MFSNVCYRLFGILIFKYFYQIVQYIQKYIVYVEIYTEFQRVEVTFLRFFLVNFQLDFDLKLGLCLKFKLFFIILCFYFLWNYDNSEEIIKKGNVLFYFNGINNLFYFNYVIQFLLGIYIFN